MNSFQSKNNILIIGGGESSRRFINSYQYQYELILCGIEKLSKTKNLAETLDFKYIRFKDLNKKNINIYKIIIISTPLGTKEEIIKKLYKLKYKNNIIVEKPFAYSVRIALKKLYYLRKNKFLVPFSREFLDYNVNFKRNNVFIWHVPKILYEKENIDDSLPHVINLIQNNLGICYKIKILEKSKNYIKFKYNKVQFEIYFKFNDGVYTLNNEILPNFNYIKANNEMIKQFGKCDLKYKLRLINNVYCCGRFK